MIDRDRDDGVGTEAEYLSSLFKRIMTVGRGEQSESIISQTFGLSIRVESVPSNHNRGRIPSAPA